MQMNLTGHHVDITQSLRDYVSTKMEKLERHFDNVTEVNVILRVEKLEHQAEATVHLSGSRIFADAVDGDMYAAIDSLSDKLDRQVRKYKEKLKDHHARDSIKWRLA